MTEPNRPRPVPGPPRPGPLRGAAPVAAGTAPAAVQETDPAQGDGPLLAALARLPVTGHVAVLEAEHARLQRELGTIDRV